MADPRALQRQELELLHAIEHPQVAIELQAVDHHRRIVEHDVLGSQVAVRFDDAARGSAGGEPVRVGRQERRLGGMQPVGAGGVEGMQHGVVGEDLRAQACSERCAVRNRRRLARIEVRQ